MGYTTELVDFTSSTTFEELPKSVVEMTKMVFLDTLICGIAAQDFERSRMIHSIVNSMGGAEESTVFGLSRRIPAPHAAMANAEIMNFLDADDTFFSSSHFAAFNVAAALAMGERTGASGKDVVLGTALGFDVNARVNLSLKILDIIDGEFQWTLIGGMGFATPGTTVSAGVVLGLDKDKMRNAFGLGGWLAPGPASARAPRQSEFWSMKYGAYPGVAMSAMLATMFAEEGYTCDHNILDGEDGFWKTQGSISTDQGLLTEDLGKKWWIEETAIKFYPSCRYTHAPIEMLKQLMIDEKLVADDIENVEVYLNPMAYSLPVFNDPAPKIDGNNHCAPFNAQFNIPYVMALTALGRPPGPGWHKPESYDDPKVVDFMKRVKTTADPAAGEEIIRALREERIGRFRKGGGSITVKAKGQKFERQSEYTAGDPWALETRVSWDMLSKKFHDYCGKLMPHEKIDLLIDNIRHIERIDNVSKLLD